MCVVSEREAVVFCPSRPRAQADRPQQPRVFEVFRPSTWSEINYTRTTVTENKLLYAEGLSHDLTKHAGHTGEEWQSPPKPLQMYTIASEMGFITESWRILNSKSCTKDNKDERTERILKKCITKYLKCMFYGSQTDAIFFCQNIKVTRWYI